MMPYHSGEYQQQHQQFYF
ncbi:unnamed protein product, partial [Rotaria magnacalcarata]